MNYYKIIVGIIASSFLYILLFTQLNAASDQQSEKTIQLLYFYDPGCRQCVSTNKIVNDVEEKFKDSINIQRFNTTDPKTGIESMDYMFELLDALGVPEDDTPQLAIFIGTIITSDQGEKQFIPEQAVLGDKQIAKELDKKIQDYINNLQNIKKKTSYAVKSVTAWAALAPSDQGGQNEQNKPTNASSDRRKRFSQAKLRFGAISTAALADGVNPCAFATVVLLVAMMTTAKRNRKETAVIGLTFTAAVYVTYFLIGLFFYNLINIMKVSGGWYLIAADLVYYGSFLLCLVCGILSLRDATLCFRGRPTDEMSLQLPDSFKKRLRIALAKGVRARWLVLGVFFAGIVVSFLEAACTGQVYLPTIMIMAELETWDSILLLLWYNFLFVLPLLIVFALALFGISSQQLANVSKNYMGYIKLALAVVFFIMAYWLWTMMYWPPGYRGNDASDGNNATVIFIKEKHIV